MAKIEVNTIDNISGSSTLKIGDTNATTLDFDTGITSVTNIPSNLKNTPAFWSYQITSGTSVPNTTATKVTNLDDEIDTDSAFASSRFTVPTGQAGKYVFYGSIQFGNSITCLAGFGLNGTGNPSFLGGYDTYFELGGEKSVSNSIMFDLSVGDYVELFAYQTSGSTQTTTLGRTRFFGYKLIT